MADDPQRFTGFPQSLYDWFDGLDEDNSKEYFHAHRPQWEASVKIPMARMLAALAPEFGVAHVFRPNRDIRFATDKRPYKDNHGAVVGGGDGGVRYVEVNGSGIFVGSGYYHLQADQVARYRVAVADEVSGTALVGLLHAARRAGLGSGEPTLVRVPRPWTVDHPRAELLRHKRMILGRSWAQPAWLHKAGAVQRVRDVWRAAAPLDDWLARFVGPSTTAARR